jgi:hypothetical protein
MKYSINYPLFILTYNVYYKAMLGIDDRFLPKEKAQANVKSIISKVLTYNSFIFGLQEAECIANIIPRGISNSNYVIGKSGKEKMVTGWSKNFQLIKSLTTDFHKGRPIQMTLLKSLDGIFLIVNLHAPHETQNFGDYKGKTKVSNQKYSRELVKIINKKINSFVKSGTVITRIIFTGDFNEFYRRSSKYQFNINLHGKSFILSSNFNKVKSCCYPRFTKPCDYIFDSIVIPKLSVSSNLQPASDHYPVETVIIS